MLIRDSDYLVLPKIKAHLRSIDKVYHTNRGGRTLFPLNEESNDVWYTVGHVDTQGKVVLLKAVVQLLE